MRDGPVGIAASMFVHKARSHVRAHRLATWHFCQVESAPCILPELQLSLTGMSVHTAQ